MLLCKRKEQIESQFNRSQHIMCNVFEDYSWDCAIHQRGIGWESQLKVQTKQDISFDRQNTSSNVNACMK